MAMKWVAGALGLAALAAGSAGAATIASADLDALHWRSIGPFRGGRVLAVAGASDDRQHFYFGAVNGGVWETRDAGRTWTPIFDSVPVGSIGALAVAPSAPKVLYVGTGEADMRSDIAQGVGMFKSVDGGAHWAAIGLADTQSIAKIIVDPRSPDNLLVAALGHPYGPNPARGVFHSADGGKIWARTLYANPDTGAVDLAFKPDDPNTVYAALWRTRRPPWSVYPPSSGPGGGLYKSGDGGLTWAPSGRGLPDSPGRIGLATAISAPSRLYALVDAKQGGGLYRSDDAGANWAKVNGDPRIWERGW
ncbi:MAG: WD40/YVTN/BNR-like repeat-containing protein, partial [Caulobacteraceae bacterium]